MGQKVHPIGFRVGIYRGWLSKWYVKNAYGKLFLEDVKIRSFLNDALESAEISFIETEKAGENVRVIVHSGRPGVVIGKKGQEIEALKNKLASLINKNVEISVQEIKSPELDAMLIAKNIAQQLVKRVSYKRAMKRAAASAMKSGAKGIKIRCGGRLGGAEIARQEWLRVGSTPLHTLRSDIDYGFAEAKTTFGVIGVAVWLCKGEYQSSKLYGI